MVPEGDITQLLIEWKKGDEHAFEELIPIVYEGLRAQARAYLRRERQEHTLQATALVHETFLHLANQNQIDWADRSHFFGIAARIMRQILVAHARRRKALKRGSGIEQRQLNERTLETAESADLDLMALDEALQNLASLDPRQSRIVELRFFAGFTIEETAEIVGCSPATVSREWKLARIWLYRRLQGSSPHA